MFCFNFVFVKFRDLYSYESRNESFQNSLYALSRTAQWSLLMQSGTFFYFLLIFFRNFHNILETNNFLRKSTYSNKIKIWKFFVSMLWITTYHFVKEILCIYVIPFCKTWARYVPETRPLVCKRRCKRWKNVYNRN